MVKVGIINVTGYAGAELARLLYLHPEAQVVCVTGRSAAGKALAQVFPHLWPLDLTVVEELDDVDFAFSALPHAASAEAVAPLVRRGLPVVDISADFRLTDAAEYAALVRRRAPGAGAVASGRLRPAGAPPRRRPRGAAGGEPRLLPHGGAAGPGAGRPRWHHRAGRGHRRQVGRVRRRPQPGPRLPLRRGQRKRVGLRPGRPPPSAGDRPGAGAPLAGFRPRRGLPSSPT